MTDSSNDTTDTVVPTPRETAPTEYPVPLYSIGEYIMIYGQSDGSIGISIETEQTLLDPEEADAVLIELRAVIGRLDLTRDDLDLSVSWNETNE